MPIAGDQFTPVMMRRSFTPSGRQPNAASITSGTPSVSPRMSPVFERLKIGAGRLEPGGEMILADEAEVLRLHRPTLTLHGGEQLGDPAIVDAVAVAEELRQRQARRADLLEYDFCLALPERPRNSLTNSRTVRGSRP